MRKDAVALAQLVDYVCLREFPDLAPHSVLLCHPTPDSGTTSQETSESKATRYVEMLRRVIEGNAFLMSEWLRVGYCHGNMNSDNVLLGGRTVDFGPFGWMERFDPRYQPFTSDPNGHFSFLNQPAAMELNIATLGESSFVPLIKSVFEDPSDHTNSLKFQFLSQLRAMYSVFSADRTNSLFMTYFDRYFCIVRQRKLGLQTLDASDEQLWSALLDLMHRAACDYTMLFRLLSAAAGCSSASAALRCLLPAFCPVTAALASQNGPTALEKEWLLWLHSYLLRLQRDPPTPLPDRQAAMNQANPKYVLRNWMAVLAYERVAAGDFSLLLELQRVLQKPYEEQPEAAQKWFRHAPDWARNFPGATFLSCSS